MFGLGSRRTVAMVVAFGLCVAAVVVAVLLGMGGSPSAPTAAARTAGPTAGRTAGAGAGPTSGPTAAGTTPPTGAGVSSLGDLSACADTSGPAAAGSSVSSEGPLTLVIGPKDPGPLVPGEKAKTFAFSVTNHSAAPLEFEPSFRIIPRGAIPVTTTDVAVTMCRIHAPSGGLVWGDGAPLSWLYPGHGSDAQFTLPAGATFSWRMGVAVTASWRGNGEGLDTDFDVWYHGGGDVGIKQTVEFDVGAVPTNGPMRESPAGFADVATAPVADL